LYSLQLFVVQTGSFRDINVDHRIDVTGLYCLVDLKLEAVAPGNAPGISMQLDVYNAWCAKEKVKCLSDFFANTG